MKPKATSKEAILAACRDIVRDQGLAGISARSVAGACGIAPGTLYNYFPDKDALVLAVTADVWSDIFGRPQQDVSDGAEKPDGEQPGSEKPGGSEGILAYVEKTFSTARAGLSRYPGFLPAQTVLVVGGADRDAQALPLRPKPVQQSHGVRPAGDGAEHAATPVQKLSNHRRGAFPPRRRRYTPAARSAPRSPWRPCGF